MIVMTFFTNCRLARSIASLWTAGHLLRRTFTRAQLGQALLEFALITPFVIFLILAVIDGGIAMDRRQVLQHAVREGARYAAVHGDVDDIKQKTVDQAQSLIDTTDVTVCYIDEDDANSTVGYPSDSVRVSVSFSYDFAIVGPVLSGLFGGSVGSVDMTPSGTARLERSVSGAVACGIPVPTVTPP